MAIITILRKEIGESLYVFAERLFHPFVYPTLYPADNVVPVSVSVLPEWHHGAVRGLIRKRRQILFSCLYDLMDDESSVFLDCGGLSWRTFCFRYGGLHRVHDFCQNLDVRRYRVAFFLFMLRVGKVVLLAAFIFSWFFS